MSEDAYNISIPVKFDGIDEITAKVEKMSALMDEIKTLAKSITESTITVRNLNEN